MSGAPFAKSVSMIDIIPAPHIPGCGVAYMGCNPFNLSTKKHSLATKNTLIDIQSYVCNGATTKPGSR
jgi:hypothetical protein